MCHLAKPCQDKSSSASRLSSCSLVNEDALLLQHGGLKKVREVYFAGEFSGSVVSKSTLNDLLPDQLQSCSGVKMRLGASRQGSTWVSTKTPLLDFILTQDIKYRLGREEMRTNELMRQSRLGFETPAYKTESCR